MFNKKLCQAIALFLVLFGVPQIYASDYPQKPITLIAPFAPGASADGIARLMARELSTVLGQSVIVENKPGAGGATGLIAVAKSAPDGYTIGMGATGAISIAPNLPDSPPLNPKTQLQPLAKVADIPLVFVASKTSGLASITAFATLLLIALLMGSNHIAARIAFNNGVDVPTAVTSRSLMTALVVSLLIYIKKVPLTLTKRHKKALPLIAILITVQSLTLYSAVARLPVSLALLAFNTYPLWTALWARVFYQHRPDKATLLAMPIMLFGLGLALDVLGASSGLGVKAQWGVIGAGVAFALTAAATFGMGLVLIQHEAHDLDGRLRTAATFWIVGILACIGTQVMGEFHWPNAIAGWWGLAALIVLYGSGVTILFTVLPKLGVVGNSAIMNVEPIFALILAWLILGQAVSFVQLLGALIVVGTVIKLGLRKN